MIKLIRRVVKKMIFDFAHPCSWAIIATFYFATKESIVIHVMHFVALSVHLFLQVIMPLLALINFMADEAFYERLGFSLCVCLEVVLGEILLDFFFGEPPI